MQRKREESQESLFGSVLQLYVLVFEQRRGTNAAYTLGYPSVDIFVASPTIVSKSSGLNSE